jgi:IstB-like ATP binding protein
MTKGSYRHSSDQVPTVGISISGAPSRSRYGPAWRAHDLRAPAGSPGHHRENRARQKLDCLRARPQACRHDRSVLYHRLPRLFDALALARGDGRHARLLKTLSRVDLLILDDWGLVPVHARSGARSSGDRRRPAWPRIHNRGDPTADRVLADHRRRHSRPPHAQRAPADIQGREHAKNGPQNCRA